jgi:peroxiredoxin
MIMMKQAPLFTLCSIKEGKEWSLTDAAKKVTMLTFWTSWCPDSQRDLQAKQKLYESLHTDELEMIMIHVTGRDPDVDVKSFLDNHHYTFPVLKDEGTKVYDQYHCMGVPTTVLITDKKEIAFVYHDKSTLMDVLKGVSSLIRTDG